MSGGDHSSYLAFARRVMKGAAKRVGDADPEDLAELVALREDLEAAIALAVEGQRARYSWGQIARGLGTTRQAAQMRYGRQTLAS